MGSEEKEMETEYHPIGRACLARKWNDLMLNETELESEAVL
jgi:hypothetical protein